MKIRNNKGAVETAIILSIIITGYIVNDFANGNGWEPVRDCIGTHVDGNCAHLPLTQTGSNNFGPSIISLEDILN